MNTTLQSREKQTLPLGQLLKTNIRDYAMYIVLVVLFVVFGILTNGLFLSPRNLTDLINQTGYVAVLAIGMTCILIISHIDLSVGYVAGFLGAVAATLLTFNGWPLGLVLPADSGVGHRHRHVPGLSGIGRQGASVCDHAGRGSSSSAAF